MNYIWHGTTLKYTVRLQWVHSVLNQRCHPPLNSSALLKQLHWLPLEWCIQFKITTLTFNALHIGRPTYLADLLQHDQPSKFLCSSFSDQQFILRDNLSFGCCAFTFQPHGYGTTCLSAFANSGIASMRQEEVIASSFFWDIKMNLLHLWLVKVSKRNKNE